MQDVTKFSQLMGQSDDVAIGEKKNALLSNRRTIARK